MASKRPFETDYAGAWRGHCKTLENAIEAAVKHLVRDSYTACTITKDGKAVKRLRLTEDGFVCGNPVKRRKR